MSQRIKNILVFILFFLSVNFILSWSYIYTSVLRYENQLYNVTFNGFMGKGLFGYFYLNAEYVILLLILSLLWNKKWINNLSSGLMSLGILFVGFLLFYIYFYFYAYGEIPLVSNDIHLLKSIVPTVLATLGLNVAININIKIIGAIIAVILLCSLLYLLIKPQIVFLKEKIDKKMVIASLVILGLVYVSQNNQRSLFFSETAHLMMIYDETRKDIMFLDGREDINNRFINSKLKKKPNIYFLFIEAYGATAQLSEKSNKRFRVLSKELDDKFINEGWFISSKYTEAPVAGGRSWLAFSTVMSGVRLKAQDAFLTLLCEQDFPHLMRFLNNNNYHTTRMHTMYSPSDDITELIEDTDNYWESDTLLMHENLPYKGSLTNPFGGIPDQYALGFYEEEIKRKQNDPSFLFFITTGSHFPWFEPSPIVDNWRKLDVTPRGGEFFDWNDFELKSMDRYMNSIDYQLRNVENFANTFLDSSDILVVLGDHQPATLDYDVPIKDVSTFCTPLHIITKNKDFHNQFINSGFEDGLYIDDYHQNYMKHEDIYPLFINKLLKVYGE